MSSIEEQADEALAASTGYGDQSFTQGRAPFRPLGYDEGHYFYLPDSTLQVVSIGAGTHTNKSYLLSLAPLEWWESMFPTKQGADWTAAANWCMRACEARGSFDSGLIRGRGAWYDAGSSVLHLGDRLQVNGSDTPITQHATRYIYERKPPMEALKTGDPLSPVEAGELIKIMGSLNWSLPVSGLLFAGWCALAPVCGALTWRPHVWVTGQRGTGKSWIVDNIVAPVLGASAVTVQSNSTEAGIRQKLRQDARPVVFDEAEGESTGARSRMQQVLELARQASSEGVAEIAKGTAGGKAMTFRVRSMFLMGSINVGLAQASDKSRFTVLTLKRAEPGPAGRRQFEALEQVVNGTLTTEWCSRLRGRTYSLIPQIRANAEVLAKAAAEHIGNQRAGDQLGALLAGAFSLLSDEVITHKDAAEWVSGQDWGMDGDDGVQSDEQALIAEILHQQVLIDCERARQSRSVAELVGLAAHSENDPVIGALDAEASLSRVGIKVAVRDQEQRIVVSESHPEIRRMLRDTPWGGGWARILERIPGGESHTSIRFHGVRHRAVSFPLDEVLE